ncbi:hypothetical protein P7C73_g2265, partial [Tremellales sp. Uapishka_1]
MREHPLLSSPLSAFSSSPEVDFATRRYNEGETWPSELGFGGRVGWKTFNTNEDGCIEVSYPEINWEQLRSDHGFPGLQYQVVLRSTVSVPAGSAPTSISIDVIQGTEYAFIPIGREVPLPVQWYNGDLYDFASSSAGMQSTGKSSTSNFARSIALAAGDYVMLVRGMYEIRMFGDPGVGKIPVIRIKIIVELEKPNPSLQRVQGLDAIPDCVDGKFMGDWFSLGFKRDLGGRERAVVGVDDESGTLEIDLRRPVAFAEGQRRAVPLGISQSNRLRTSVDSITLLVHLREDGKDRQMQIEIPITHRDTNDRQPFKITFASSAPPSREPPALVSHAVVVPPPSSEIVSPPPPVILALHGAGVDISDRFWADAIPRIQGGWAVLPTGRNEWGEDWHGGSMADVLGAREAFGVIIGRLGIVVSAGTLLMGHSNGGQGACHLAARYPDKFIGVVIAAGYVKIQDYVPYTSLVSSHFADPALMGIVMSALTPYNNDLYLSNLVHLPILIIQGAADNNVPPRHSRAIASILSAWEGKQASSNVTLVEVPKMGHWWDTVLDNDAVKDFIRNLPKRQRTEEDLKRGFTLTTANPDESGGRAGIRIRELETPGRLARVEVNVNRVTTGIEGFRCTNVRTLEVSGAVHTRATGLARASMDSQSDLSSLSGEVEATRPRAYGPMIRLLSSSTPFTFIVGSNPLHRSIASRMVNDLYLYHRIDAEITSDLKGLQSIVDGTMLRGAVVAIGGPWENKYTEWMVAQKRIPVEFPTKGVMTIGDRLVYEGGTGIMSLHPHPTSPTSLSALIVGLDDEGLESTARLFPLRTGVPVPDWVVVGPRATWRGAGGFIGAGFWNGQWGWSEAMSWVDR